MSPKDVPAELVEKAAEFGFNLMAEGGRDIGRWADLPLDDISKDYHRVLARYHLAAVLPDARLAAKVEAVTGARKVISQYLATAEKWRYDRVMWAFAIMLGEIPEDAPCPDSPADARERAARLTATTGEPT